MRVIIFGDGAWAANSLRPLVDAGHEILAVVLRIRPSDSTLETAARKLDVQVLQPNNVNASEFVELVKWMDASVGVSIAYNQIIKQPLLNSTQLGFVNFHAGKLPNYRGRNIINWAIINGESEIGITAHLVDEGIDTGDIILQRVLPIGWLDDYGDVLRRVVDHFPRLVVDALCGIESGKLIPRPQRHLAGTYFSGRVEGDEWLDWSATSLELYNKVRAITRPGPGARTSLNFKVITIFKAAYDPCWPKYIATPGQVVGKTDQGVVIKTGDSTLVVQEVQLEEDWCGKPTWPIGTRLGLNVDSVIHSLEDRIRKLESQVVATEGLLCK
jgi:methionyl-tRNA formyltransferase